MLTENQDEREVPPVESIGDEGKLEDGIALCLPGGVTAPCCFTSPDSGGSTSWIYLPHFDRVSSVSGGSISAEVLALKWSNLAFDGSRMQVRTALLVTLVAVCCSLLLGCGAPHRTVPISMSRAAAGIGSVPAVSTRLYELDANGVPLGLPATVEEARKAAVTPENAWEELDDIYGLMALAVVHADCRSRAPTGASAATTSAA